MSYVAKIRNVDNHKDTGVQDGWYSLKTGPEGAHGKICLLEDYLIAKIYHPKVIKGNPEIPQKEFDIMKRLYASGISVPKPEGLFEFLVTSNVSRGDQIQPTQDVSIGLVMEYLTGMTVGEAIKVDKTYSKLANEIEEMYATEILKCTGKGLKLKDLQLGNAIYSPEKDKVFLIDFSTWEFV